MSYILMKEPIKDPVFIFRAVTILRLLGNETIQLKT